MSEITFDLDLINRYDRLARDIPPTPLPSSSARTTLWLIMNAMQHCPTSPARRYRFIFIYLFATPFVITAPVTR